MGDKAKLTNSASPSGPTTDWIRVIEEGGGFPRVDLDTFRRLIEKTQNYRFFQVLRKHVKLDDAVLEAGCGWAVSSFALAREGIHVVALDISDKLIQDLQNIQHQWGKGAPNSLELLVGDLFKLDELGRQFACIFSDGTYQHFLHPEERKEILENLHRRLRHKGKLIVAVPNMKNPFFKFVVGSKMPPMQTFGLKSLRQELERGRFEVIEDGCAFVNAGFEQWLKARWLTWPVNAVNQIFERLPRLAQSLFAAHIYCVARKR